MDEQAASAGGGAGGQCAALMEAARPELYQLNAFRVTELHVDVTARDIARQVELAKLQEKFGVRVKGTRGALPLTPRPDGGAVREAMQRLRDPERRLVDELFWFWPCELGRSRDDPALRALAAGEVKDALLAWAAREKTSSDSGVSTHNLAVLYHTLALDIELKGRVERLAPQQVELRDKYWRAAYQRWKALLDHEGFWSRLSARIRELDDPRLTTGTARRIRAALPLALLSINAQIALRAAERGDKAEAARQLDYMRSWGTNGAIEEALCLVLKPVRERLNLMCKKAGEQAEADPPHADKVVRSLLADTRPLLAIVDNLMPETSLTRVNIHDEVAITALQCQIVYGNKTEDWRVSIGLLELTLPVAASDSARDRIKENIRIVKENMSYLTCWFCGERDSKDASKVEVKMYGEVERIPIWGGVQIRWKSGTFTVPRCPVCQSAHKALEQVGNAAGIGGLLGFLAGIGPCSLIAHAGEDAWVGGILVSVILIAVGACIGHAIGKANYAKVDVPKDVKPYSAFSEFPLIKEKLGQGWQFGERPTG